jgi:hypothetical protein
VAAREADKLIQDGKVLMQELNTQKSGALKETKKFVSKAGKSTKKVANVAAKEVRKDLKGNTKKGKK